jgi:hypothetical protein
MKTVKPRVDIPRNPEQLLALAQRIYSRHLELGAQSPLTAMVSHSWAQNGELITQCLNLHEQAEEAKRRMEDLYRQRDVALAEISETVRASRDILIGAYRELPKTLGEFGFNVDDTTKKTKKIV